jgi:hypothetical protein
VIVWVPKSPEGELSLNQAWIDGDPVNPSWINLILDWEGNGNSAKGWRIVRCELKEVGE